MSVPEPAPQPDADARLERFRREVAELELRAPGDRDERLWSIAGVGLLVASLLAIGLAWWGASGTAEVHQQVPYVISGGLAGVALAAVGGAVLVRASLVRYLRWWFLRFTHEQRVQADRTVEVLERIEVALSASGQLAEGAGVDATTDGEGTVSTDPGVERGRQ